MRLFLIRHGESVDNVAGLYAGSRDSALTAHGVLQARRLGSHLAQTATEPLLHIFSSDLQRAAVTAQAIADVRATAPAVVLLPDLRERDFRSTEGVKIGSSRAAAAGGGRIAQQQHPDAETQAEMAIRAGRVIDVHLSPILQMAASASSEHTPGIVVVVAHGIILNVLLRSLLTRYASPAELARLVRPGLVGSEWLASWSNTGYLEAVVASKRPGLVDLRVVSINNTDHLQGLKKSAGASEAPSTTPSKRRSIRSSSRLRTLLAEQRGSSYLESSQYLVRKTRVTVMEAPTVASIPRGRISCATSLLPVPDEPRPHRGLPRLQNQKQTPNRQRQPDPILNLPPSFGSAYVGETFSCTLCANHDTPEVSSSSRSPPPPQPPNPAGHTPKKTISNVRIEAEMKTPGSGASVKLDLLGGGTATATAATIPPSEETLEPAQTLQRIVHFDLKEEGNHVLAVTVSYYEASETSGRTRTFRKLYQFVCKASLIVRTKPSTLQEEGGCSRPSWRIAARMSSSSNGWASISSLG